MKITEYVEKKLSEYIPLLKLQHFDIRLSGFESADDVNVVFTTLMNFPYKRADIRIGPAAKQIFSEKRHGEIDLALLHELNHVILWRYSILAKRRHVSKRELDDENEQLCDTYATILHELVKT